MAAAQGLVCRSGRDSRSVRVPQRALEAMRRQDALAINPYSLRAGSSRLQAAPNSRTEELGFRLAPRTMLIPSWRMRRNAKDHTLVSTNRLIRGSVLESGCALSRSSWRSEAGLGRVGDHLQAGQMTTTRRCAVSRSSWIRSWARARRRSFAGRSRPGARFPGIRDVRERLRTGRLWFWEPELID